MGSSAIAIGSSAVPILGAAVGAADLLFAVGNEIADQFQGCGITCQQATSIVNSVATLGELNLKTYFGIPLGTRTVADQAQALKNYDLLWYFLVNKCGNPALGDAGNRCISEREPGGKFDFALYYRAPIANDPGPLVQSGMVSQASIGEGTSAPSLETYGPPQSTVTNPFTGPGYTSSSAGYTSPQTGNDTSLYWIAGFLILTLGLRKEFHRAG